MLKSLLCGCVSASLRAYMWKCLCHNIFTNELIKQQLSVTCFFYYSRLSSNINHIASYVAHDRTGCYFLWLLVIIVSMRITTPYYTFTESPHHIICCKCLILLFICVMRKLCFTLNFTLSPFHILWGRYKLNFMRQHYPPYFIAEVISCVSSIQFETYSKCNKITKTKLV